MSYVFGPVPSRRLGRSLGIDVVPFKTCTYDCIYCQLGRTTNQTLERTGYIDVDRVLAGLQERLSGSTAPDYIGIAGSGEPTLHSGIGTLIRSIKNMTDIPVAVLTNGSLLWMSEVQDDLMAADLVLPSLDAGDEDIFRYVNRPHRNISFERMIDGLVAFAGRSPGDVWLEVLLLGGVTGIASEVAKIAACAERIAPARVQLNTVVRPPSEDFAYAVPARQLESFVSLFGVPADVVGTYEDNGSPDEPSGVGASEEVIALLHRRPCSAMDIAAGLGINPAEVLKILDALLSAGSIEVVKREAPSLYVAKRDGS
jgi:wyosine [tRNA(Phe)-imidazoG37] synthetase (radical SAM superfamily)